MTTEDDQPPAPPELDSRPQSRREWSGYLRSLVLPLALVVVIVGGLLWWQARRGGNGESAGYGTVALPAAKNATSKPASPEVDRAAPDFLLHTPDGSSLRLSDLQGKPVLLNFWASWCVSCRQETPDLIKTYDAHKPDGLVILGVDLREADDRITDYAQQFGIDYPVAVDRSGEVARTWHIGGPMEGLPSSYFIDSSGVVRKVVYGTLTTQLMADGLTSILGPAGS